MPLVSNDLLIELRNIFRERFSMSDLSDLAQEVGTDIENLPGSSKNEKARELATYLGRRDKVGLLATVGPKGWPDVPWVEILRRHNYPLPVATEPGAQPSGVVHVPAAELQRLVPVLADYPAFNQPGTRRDLLAITDVLRFVDVDLNGSARQVAGGVLLRLNERGEIAPGDMALGRLLRYLLADDTLPQGARNTITAITTQYNIS